MAQKKQLFKIGSCPSKLRVNSKMKLELWKRLCYHHWFGYINHMGMRRKALDT